MSDYKRGVHVGRRLNLVILAALVFLLSISTACGRQYKSSGVQAAASSPSPNVYLPLAVYNHPPTTIFGIRTKPLSSSTGLDQVAAAQATWVRRDGPLWMEVEPVEGQLNWGAAASIDQELLNAASAGLQIILVVRTAPAWAHHPDTIGHFCGPIAPEKLTNFTNYMLQLVARYSAPPFNIRYFELWNEPDIDPFLLMDPDSGFGCWGDQDDLYYGGGYYAEMLQAVYGPLKLAFPNIKILVGGLLLDCNPAVPGACISPHGVESAAFLEGILRHNGLNDGSNYFDGVSFHAYDFYGGTEGSYANSNWGTTWNTVGPVLIAKAEFINSVLSQFNAPNKLLMNTESAILCDICANDGVFESTKASYLAQNYAAAIDAGLRANIWYSALGWRNSGLLNFDLTSKPAYDAFVYSRQILSASDTLGPVGSTDISDPSGINGYRFDRGDREIWVLWSNDGNPHQVNLIPGQPIAVYDLYGSPISTTMTVTVDIDPTYIEWDPN